MFKKLVSLLLSLSVSTSFAGPVSDLKTAFEELNYSLTVDWDQKNEDFYQTQIQIFSEYLQSLHAQGLTNKEVIDFISSQVKDENQKKIIQQAYQKIEINKLTNQDIEDFLTTIQKTNAHGASWNGTTTIVVGSIIVIGAAVAALLLLNLHNDDSSAVSSSNTNFDVRIKQHVDNPNQTH